MRTVGDAIQKIQALLGDPRGQWVKQGYVMPILDITYASILLNIKNASAKNLYGIVTLLNVPAGTTSLYPWQNATGKAGDSPVGENAPAVGLAGGIGAGAPNPQPLLAGLFDPIQIFVKPAGAAVSRYARLNGPRDTLPHTDPSFIGSGAIGPRMCFSFVGNQLRITPVNAALDIEVTGRFNAPPLASPDQLLTGAEDIWIPTVFKTAALCGVERSNPQILAGYAAESTASQDNLIAQLMRTEQGNPARFQKMSREGGMAAWFWGI
jgi:hypothetical protein